MKKLALYLVLIPFLGISQNRKIHLRDSTQHRDIKEVRFTKLKSVKSEIEKKGFAVNVIETKETALRNVQIVELLDKSVGVRVRQNGGLGSGINLNINGMSGNAVKIMINGVPASTYGASFDLNSIPTAMIERVEVYKGVVPGSIADDALGGVINIILKNDIKNQFNASVSYGSFNTIQTQMSGTYRDPKSGFTTKFNGFYNYSDNDYKVWGDFIKVTLPNGRMDPVVARRFNDAFSAGGILASIGFSNVKWADELMLSYNKTNSYKEIQHGVYMTVPYKGRSMTSDADVLTLDYRKKNLLLKGLDVNIQGIYSHRERLTNDTVRHRYNWLGEVLLDRNQGLPILSTTGAQQGRRTMLNITSSIYSSRANVSYSINRHHRFVFSHLFQSIKREEDDEILTPLEREFTPKRNLVKNISSLSYETNAFRNKLKTNIYGKLFQQDIERIDNRANIANNQTIRYTEINNSTVKEHSFGGALSYLIKPAIVVLASAEKAVRLPNENEVFGEAGENIIPNFNIRPEKSHNYNIGFKIGPYKLNHHSLSLSSNFFIRDTRDKIVRRMATNITDAIQVEPFENLGKTISKGVDIELNYFYKKHLNIGGNFSRFDARYNNKYDNNGNILALYGKQLPREPYMTANAFASYSINDFLQKKSQLRMHYNFQFVDSFYNVWVISKNIVGYDNFKTPRQYLHDIGMSYFFPNKQWVVSLDVRNLFNRQAFDNFAVQKPGRAFFMKINYQFNNL
ncbi:TonB-dependent receptor [Riemerella anatipestifer]|uniref:TonB-dependent receptor n=1 Tax=Riemerella anatipestifer TaxID=34085 RepID=UPI0030BC9415